MSTATRDASKAQQRRVNLFRREDEAPAVITHRGNNSAGLPPNTVPSLLRAVDDGADWVEVDVQLSADGDLVLYHDVMHEGDEIRRLSTREVQRRGLATLGEVADAIPDRVGLFLDVKHACATRPGRTTSTSSAR